MCPAAEGSIISSSANYFDSIVKVMSLCKFKSAFVQIVLNEFDCSSSAAIIVFLILHHFI